MRIKFDNDLLVIYLYAVKLNLFNSVELTSDIKSLLKRIINYYNINLSGMYKVIIYENKVYGYVLELFKIKDFEYGDFLDLKLEIKYDQIFYLIVDNYWFIENIKKVFYVNGLYYVNLCDLKDVNIIFEYGDIFYKDKNNLLANCVNLEI